LLSLLFAWLPLASSAEIDPLTSLSTGAAAYLTTTAAHEVGGHGLGCLAAGGRPLGFSSTYMVCDTAGMSPGGVRLGTFSGTGANLLPGFRTGGHGFGGAVGRDALPIDVEVSAKRETA
jgi:hypothetical protein